MHSTSGVARRTGTLLLAALLAKGVVIEGAGRGILGSFSDLNLQKVHVLHSLWNGMSIAGQHIKMEDTKAQFNEHFGIYLMDPTKTATIEIYRKDDLCNI